VGQLRQREERRDPVVSDSKGEGRCGCWALTSAQEGGGGRPAARWARGKDGPRGQNRERRDFHFVSFYFQNFQMDFQKGFEFLFTCNKNQSITNKICSSMSASTCL